VQQAKSIRSIKGGLWQTIEKAIRAVVVNKAVANKAVVAKKEAAARETKAAADKVAKGAASKATAELTNNTKRVMSSAEFVTRFHLYSIQLRPGVS
jgi:hypothetical protein